MNPEEKQQYINLLRQYPCAAGVTLVSVEENPQDVLLAAQFAYKAARHRLCLRREEDGLYWVLSPYNRAFFRCRARPYAWAMIQTAIIEHSDLHLQS